MPATHVLYDGVYYNIDKYLSIQSFGPYTFHINNGDMRYYHSPNHIIVKHQNYVLLDIKKAKQTHAMNSTLVHDIEHMITYVFTNSLANPLIICLPDNVYQFDNELQALFDEKKMQFLLQYNTNIKCGMISLNEAKKYYVNTEGAVIDAFCNIE